MRQRKLQSATIRRCIAAALVTLGASIANAQDAAQNAEKPNILVIWGDDVGQSNISAYSHGVMGYQTPNIDRIAAEGMMFTDYYGEQSCTAGRSSFVMGQSVFRTGLSKVGLPGAEQGMQTEDPTVNRLLLMSSAPSGWADSTSRRGNFRGAGHRRSPVAKPP